MRISDWSSDVCSSDLGRAATASAERADPRRIDVASGLEIADRRQHVISAGDPGQPSLIGDGVRDSARAARIDEQYRLACRIECGCLGQMVRADISTARHHDDRGQFLLAAAREEY